MVVLKSGWNLHTHDSPLKGAIWLVVFSSPIWLVWHTYISHSSIIHFTMIVKNSLFGVPQLFKEVYTSINSCLCLLAVFLVSRTACRSAYGRSHWTDPSEVLRDVKMIDTFSKWSSCFFILHSQFCSHVWYHEIYSQDGVNHVFEHINDAAKTVDWNDWIHRPISRTDEWVR